MIVMQARAWYITRRSHIPPILRRWSRVGIGVYVLWVLMTATGFMILHFTMSAAVSPLQGIGYTVLVSTLGVCGLTQLLVIVFTIADLLMVRRWRSRARSLQGRMCGNCLHDLRGLGDAGHCPECGHPFSLDQLRRYWKGVEIPPTPVP